MANQTEEQPLVTLARDEFTVERRRLDGHPEAVKAQSRIDVVDAYDNITTWVIDLYRLRNERTKSSELTALVQRITAGGGQRLVLPPQVTDAFIRHAAGLITKHRKKQARRSVADLRAQTGEVVETKKTRKRRKAVR